ncbi:MAG: hypothetical protein A2Z88_02795 [Omnitrophica WOR_2 bacterium GWA2_47_8]|nr:MAG: hypothetical protein A2Z88_02795 [Omnitrophica WOR_2 bacterium GWA2_47_8]
MKIKYIILLIGAVLAGMAGFAAWAVMTTRGSEFFVRQLLNAAVKGERVKFDTSQGSLADGIAFQNLEISQLKGLPQGSIVKVQSIYFNSPLWGFPRGLTVRVDNARFFLPESDPIVLFGTWEKGQLDGNLFTPRLSVADFRQYFPQLRKLPNFRDQFQDVDIHVIGPPESLQLKGKALLAGFSYKNLTLSNCPLTMDLKVDGSATDTVDKIKLLGAIETRSGQLQIEQVTIDMARSILRFNGPVNQPQFNLSATSTVDKVKIHIRLTGTIAKPDLVLNSYPPYAQEQLLVMLATGKKWDSISDSLDKGKLSPELSKDFIDYVLFGGKASAIAKKIGLKELNVTYDEQRQGIYGKQGITDRFDVGYGVEKQTGATTPLLNQTISGEYRVTDKVSVGAERELKSPLDQQTSGSEVIAPVPNDKIFLKYKKEF